MSNAGVPAFVSLLVAGCLYSSIAMPRPRQEAVNDRPVIGKWSFFSFFFLFFKWQLLLFCFLFFYSHCPAGILTQMVTDEPMKPFGNTYIPASYVKYIESGGSRVLPIR